MPITFVKENSIKIVDSTFSKTILFCTSRTKSKHQIEGANPRSLIWCSGAFIWNARSSVRTEKLDSANKNVSAIGDVRRREIFAERETLQFSLEQRSSAHLTGLREIMFDLNGNFPLGFICVAPRNFSSGGGWSGKNREKRRRRSWLKAELAMWIIDGKNNLRQDKYDSERGGWRWGCVRVRETRRRASSLQKGETRQIWPNYMKNVPSGGGRAGGSVKIIDMILD